MQVSLKQCEIWLKEDTSKSGQTINKLVKVPLTQGQYDVLISFIHNFGETKYAGSTFLKKTNQGLCKDAGQEILKWSMGRVNGKLVRIQGLYNRRLAEYKIWTEGCD